VFCATLPPELFTTLIHSRINYRSLDLADVTRDVPGTFITFETEKCARVVFIVIQHYMKGTRFVDVALNC
jgi:hypothetical protein